MKKKNIIIACELIIILVLVTIIILLQFNNKTNNNNEITPKITETVEEGIIQKYQQLSYKNQTELETLVSYKKIDQNGHNVSAYIDAKFEIKNGKLTANAADGSLFADKVYINSEDTNKKIVIKGIDENVKTIAAFNTNKYGGPTSSIAVLTEDGNLYRKDKVELIDNELTLEFKKLDLNKKIIGLFVNEKYEEYNSMKDALYVLTSENELYILKGYSTDVSELGFKYEERIIQYEPHENYGFSNISIFKSDDTVEIKGINENIIKIQYNNEPLKIKTLFLKSNSEHYINLYVVDENDNIYVTKKAISIEEINRPGYDRTQISNECYELEQYVSKKVSSVKYINDETLTIEYDDDSKEVSQYPEYAIEYFYTK